MIELPLLEEHLKSLKKEQWAKLFSLLEPLNSNLEHGKLIGSKKQSDGTVTFPFFDIGPVVERLVHVIYELNIAPAFDWDSWIEGRQILNNQNRDFSTLSPIALCKLLTLILRKDRFLEGFLVSRCNDGTMSRIIGALKKKFSPDRPDQPRRYFTKSRFRLALECPTKLYYGANKSEYTNQSNDDPFLMALAEGGYQVGELAKYLFCDDPEAEDIAVEGLDYQKSLDFTAAKRSKEGKVVIAEAAFLYENFFVRTDLLVEDKDTINIYEVKAKSWNSDVVFLKSITKGKDKGKEYLDRGWRIYLYDIAFQKWVVSKANPQKKVIAHLVLVDKTVETSIDGLNQLFKIDRNGPSIHISPKEGITREDLGRIPLKVINVEQECDWIFSNLMSIDLDGQWSFEELVYFLAGSFQANDRVWSSRLAIKCKDCEFINVDFPLGQKSGIHECWMKLANCTAESVREKLILEIWGGKGASIVNKAISAGVFHLKHATESLYAPKDYIKISDTTLDPTQRRSIQILKSATNDFTPYLDKPGLTDIFDQLKAPYHFIDFETTTVALPFHKNRRPYEAIAFQYSYHLMDEKGNINHQNQYLSFEKGFFPNYEFLRSLRKDLSGKPGTIFRFHQHENNYLNHIYKQLIKENTSDVPDKAELMAFIKEISKPTTDAPDQWTPINEMQDLWELVLKHFYSLYAKGSNSIKDILPAVIKSSEYIREKYSQPIYGTPVMPSLNFKSPHIWITQETGLNPYKTLPDLFSDADKIRFELTDNSMIEVDNGGAAMIAYAYLQFTDITEEQRKIYRDGLLRYCELDTMAMVMIWDYWGHELGKW